MAKKPTGNLPESWARSESLRRLLRSSKTAREAAPSREVGKTRSKKKGRPSLAKFDHRRSQSEHAESGSITFYETRGVRDSSETFLFSDFEETLSLANHTGYAEAETYASLFEVANQWLRETGEKDFFGVADDADEATASAKTWKQKHKIDRLTFQRWWFETGMKNGFLSPPAAAAKFLAASDFVHRLTKGNQQLQRAIYQFADAWHWMRFEGSDEHELAAVGLKSIQGRAQGPAVKQERAELKKKLLNELYDGFASDERNGAARKSAKGAAGAMFSQVNKKLKELGLNAFAEKTLADELRPLVKARFPRPKKQRAT
ncbi:hypothetical protein SAMN04487925_110216 [Bradyrhizobium sp. cf659]|nr:hypothetical protein SAMN04487925_110216 [Bradyrhizobium sp. cf659]